MAAKEIRIPWADQVQFLYCKGFINFLTAWPWAERGSCFARGLFLFLTARPGAEAQFFIYPWFIFNRVTRLFCKGFIFINCAAVGVRRSCSVSGLFFLTVQPGAEVRF